MDSLNHAIKSFNKTKVFWLLNSVAWIVILGIILIYDNEAFVSWQNFYLIVSIYIMGFLLTLGVRKFLKSRFSRITSISKLLVYTFLTTLVSAVSVWVLHFIVIIPLFIKHGSTVNEQVKQLTLVFRRMLFSGHSLILILVLLSWIVLYLGTKFWLYFREEQDRAKQAIIEAQKAQLQMLRYQLNPHFLFNSLNSIWALVEEDPITTKLMINESSDFLRYSLLHDDKAYKSLKYEVNALENYFAIEKKRFQEKLIVEFDIDPGTNELPVLSFLLQPFVENAIKFGMKTSKMPLKITIGSKLEGDRFRLFVSNTGHWIEPLEIEGEGMDSDGTGLGLKNTKNRLDIAYGEQYTLELQKESNQVKVTLSIPNNN